MWQEIAVVIIGIAIVAYTAISIYRMVVRRNDPCCGCTGCELRKALDKKRPTCPDKKPKD